jgi:hypothetical protein
LEDAPHYVETKPAREYAGKRVFIIGKRNSGFENADAMLPWAQRIILGSPRPPVLSILHAGGGVRAKYLIPYEDHVMGGGVAIVDASIERVERRGAGWRVFTSGPSLGPMPFDVDEVIVATGFTSPLGDLPDLGVATFNHGRLPRLTHYWESATAPGIFFAGTITQAAPGLRKHGSAGNSAAVGGFRHNARVLANYLAQEHFGVRIPKIVVRREDVVSYLLSEVTTAPELWNQQAYLARVVCFDPDRGIVDQGIQPLAAFVDATGPGIAPNAVAVSVEVNAESVMHPGVYVRRNGQTTEHALPPDPLLNFERDHYRVELEALLKDLG